MNNEIGYFPNINVAKIIYFDITGAFPFSIVLLILILFSLDPETSLVADNTSKQNYRDIATSDDKFNKNKTNSKIQNDKHLCPECKSHSLTNPIDKS
jgi:RNA polymerase subunit RPABC4/transcription elongation factor Spt4